MSSMSLHFFQCSNASNAEVGSVFFIGNKRNGARFFFSVSFFFVFFLSLFFFCNLRVKAKTTTDSYRVNSFLPRLTPRFTGLGPLCPVPPLSSLDKSLAGTG